MIIESLRSLAVPIESLRGLPGNPRRGDVDAVAASLSRFGQRKPIVVRKDDGTIIAGNHTWQAAKKLGWSEIAVAYVGDDDVTAQAYALADNRTAELGDYDDELLKQLIESVGQIDPDLLHDTGWSDDAVKELLDKIESELPKVVDEDEVPEPPIEPKTKLGDLYHLGRHRLLCGDSTDEATVARLMDGAKADMVFTDPPYGINLDTDYSKMGNTTTKYSQIKNDDKPFDFSAIWKMTDAPIWYVWGADYYPNTISEWNNGSIIVWAKAHSEDENKVFGSSFEISWRFPKTKKEIWFVRRIHMTDELLKAHPTQKPLALPRRALERDSKKDDLILDFFLGSGTTLIACEEMGRICYGLELDPKYCDVIIQRWETLTGEKAKLISNAESAQA
jgi:DNA modification methylase